MIERGFFLGTTTGDAPERMVLDPADLTTHGVVVGMTGSGKTGLLVGLLEEALRNGVPAVVVDPKGDLANLCLTFPDLAPADFRPWVDPEKARREGLTPEALAEKTAAAWRAGLARDGLGPDDIRRLRDGSLIRLFTPGSEAGLPVNVLSGFDPPALDWETDAEAIRERIASSVSALLERAGENADPLQSPAHIFLANLFENRWRAGERPDLAAVLGYLLHPPFAKLGVLHVDAFYPPADRRQTVQKLNALLASPSFASWQQGVPLRLDRLLEAPAGRTPLGLFYTAHLGDEDRKMFATLLLGEIIAWMRGRSGTGSLRMLVVMDEVWGLMPPHPANPPTKAPMLTLLKQARAFGVGMVLATQNPVDLDYKGLTNAGVWGVGRLSTERDKARLLDGLDMVAGGGARSESDEVISRLAPRQFLLRNVHDTGGAKVFSTRWVMSYLRGPLTLDEVRGLGEASAAPGGGEGTAAPAGPAKAASAVAAEPSGGEPDAPRLSPAAMSVPPGVPVYYLEPRALQPDRVRGAVSGAKAGPPRRYRPALLGRATVRFDERRAGLDHTQTEWRLLFPLEGSGGWRWPDADAPDLSEELAGEPVPGVAFEILPPALEAKGTYRDLERDLKDTLFAAEQITLYHNPGLKEYSKVGESRDDFAKRLNALAEDAADQEVAGLRDKYLKRRRRIEDRIERETIDVARAEADVRSRKQETLVSVGESLLGMFLGGRKSSRVLSRTTRQQRMTGSARSRLQKEEAQLRSATEELDRLEEDLGREIDAVREEQESLAAEIKEFPVALERDDVRVEEVALVWIPDAG